MCGIAGIASNESTGALVAQLDRMLTGLVHRGPDDSGILACAPREGLSYTLDRAGRRAPLTDAPRAASASVVLGNRRLAIIDLSSGGHQPMVSADGRYAIVVNGEIYNYLELRQELEACGRRFRSRSDTEVLLVAFEEWGGACLSRLVGMFALAILDRRARRLFLARDPFGIKPLYYVTRPDALSFASEIPPLLSLLDGPPRAHPQRVHDYLQGGSSDHGGESMFAEVQAMPPAHYAIIDLERPDRVAPAPYWRPDLERTLDISFAEAAARLREMFLESVSLHLRSDVRVGTLLSGGTDSSAVVMAMRHLGGPNLEIATFSYVGEQGAVSEEPWIDVVNAAAGATPHKIHLVPGDWAADLEHLIETQGEPFGSLAIHIQHRVYRRAAAVGAKVTLDGQGGDELLAGYRWHRAARLTSLLDRGHAADAFQLLRHIARDRQSFDPPVSRVAVQALKQALPAGLRTMLRKLRRRRPLPWIDAEWCRRHGIGSDESGYPVARQGRRLGHALWRSVERGSLPGLLRYGDRNAMAHSVESRLPFLTPQLAEFLLSLPEEFLVGPDATSKRVFREAMRGIVPDPILERRDKVGFAVPIQSWLPAIPSMIQLLEFATQTAPVNGRHLEPALAALRAGHELSVEHSYVMWRLATFAAWIRRYGVNLD